MRLPYSIRRSLQTRPDDIAAWPEGVVLRYLTLGGATVDITQRPGDNRFNAHCTGCGEDWGVSTETYSTNRGHEHSEKCRALPRP